MKIILGLMIILAVIGGFTYYVWNSEQKPQPAPVVAKEFQLGYSPSVPDPVPHRSVEIRPARPTSTLPKLDDSDTNVTNELTHLFGRENLFAYLQSDKIIRRFVATIDNLPRKKAPQRMMVLKPVSGNFMVTETGLSQRIIDPGNGKRYVGYVDLIQAVSVQSLVDLYIQLYPLCQQAYRELGYPDGVFNDRLMETLNDLLDAPEVSAPVGVAQPRVLYEFADNDLEALSAGQKIMIRLGLANEAKIKAIIRKIRSEIQRRART
ncbi:MAG: DUF3014 domain-containing protein [Georgfuchsia sp.]